MIRGVLFIVADAGGGGGGVDAGSGGSRRAFVRQLEAFPLLIECLGGIVLEGGIDIRIASSQLYGCL